MLWKHCSAVEKQAPRPGAAILSDGKVCCNAYGPLVAGLIATQLYWIDREKRYWTVPRNQNLHENFVKDWGRIQVFEEAWEKDWGLGEERNPRRRKPCKMKQGYQSEASKTLPFTSRLPKQSWRDHLAVEKPAVVQYLLIEAATNPCQTTQPPQIPMCVKGRTVRELVLLLRTLFFLWIKYICKAVL